MIYRNIIRPILFLFNPELIHKVVLTLLKLPFVNTFIALIYKIKSGKLEKTVFGVKFPNPIGLAAGFDKSAAHVNSFSAMGFGFVEVGTITPVFQPGNDKPRLFRLKKDKAIINRMGFNSDGVTKTIHNIKKAKPGIIIGGNIGKNKVTANAAAVEDYTKGFEALFNYVDYFAVNVSSPNTPGLRELQEKEPLTHILKTLQLLNDAKDMRKPILLKIAPDLTDSQIDDIVEIVKETKIDGIIATNTTIGRSGLKTASHKIDEIGNGGLSGKPLFQRSTEVVRYIKSKSDIPVIGVGGIMSAADALQKIKAGADLIQIYSGLIYEGPGLVRKINKSFMQKI